MAKKTEIRIFKSIGGHDGITAADIATQLKAAGNVQQIDVLLNSPGGVVFDGIAIYNELRQHPAKVNVSVRGAALSAASLVAMAGDTIQMEEGSFLMIHNAMGLTLGDKADHRSQAELLDKLDGQLAGIYAARSGKSAETVLEMMQAETWFTAEEAVAAKFADRTEKSRGGAQVITFGDSFVSRYRNTPAEFAAKFTTKEGKGTMGASIQELKQACPGASADFLLAQVEADATVEQAQREFISELQKKGKGSYAGERPGNDPVGSGSSSNSYAGGDPVAEWDELVESFTAKGMTKTQAIAAANRKNPELRLAYVAAYNAEHGRMVQV